MKYNGYYIYFYFLLAIVLVSSMKSIMMVAYRAPALLRESQVPSWRTRTNGGFSILPLLFIFCGLSVNYSSFWLWKMSDEPLYYDLLLTSQSTHSQWNWEHLLTVFLEYCINLHCRFFQSEVLEVRPHHSSLHLQICLVCLTNRKILEET